MAYQQKE